MINSVTLIGSLGQDPEVRQTSSGTAVATLSVATNRNWKDKNGNKKSEVEWHRVIVWDKTAEFCAEYLKKGSRIYVTGRLQTRKWQDQEGNQRYTTEIIANILQNLSPRNEGGQSHQESGQDNGDNTDVPF